MENDSIYFRSLSKVEAFMQQLRSLALSDEDSAVKLYDKHTKKLDGVMQNVLSALATDIGLAYGKRGIAKDNPRARELFADDNLALPVTRYAQPSAPAQPPPEGYYYEPNTTGNPPMQQQPTTNEYYHEGGTPISEGDIGNMLNSGGVTNRAANQNMGVQRKSPARRIPMDENGRPIYPD